MSDKVSRLPEWEWSFDSLPDDELEACFWWEFIRTGLDPDLRNELAKEYTQNRDWWDDGGQDAFADALCRCCRVNKGTKKAPRMKPRFVAPGVLMNLLCTNDVPLVSDERRPHRWKRPADFFFDHCAWQQLPEPSLLDGEAVGEPGAQTPVIKRVTPVRYAGEVARSFSKAILAALVFPLHVEERLETVPKKLPPELKGYRPRPAGRIDFQRDVPVEREAAWVAFRVDWQFRDEEILAHVARYLREARPRNWPEPKHRYRGVIESGRFSSPRTYLRGLRGLGVLRRRESVQTWNDFRADYGDRGSNDALKKQVQYARKLIAWMNPIPGSRG